MFIIKPDNTIYLTRGDTAHFIITILDDEDEPIELESTDKIYLTVKEDLDKEEIAIQKEVTGSNVIEIKPNDTKSLNCGRYLYDIQYVTTIEGEKNVYTLVIPTTFTLGQEVTLVD